MASSCEGEKRGRYLTNAPHKNSDNIRGILGNSLYHSPLPEPPIECSRPVAQSPPKAYGIERWYNALRMLEDVYFALTTMDEQGMGRRSAVLSRLGMCILEVKKAADDTIAAFSYPELGRALRTET
ncbi:hypothetical protein ACHHYP_20064 [Achlya hypogyna]|uniref:Uncharacterized protein n=1 Tax=Achlya hypogyna TaxID=1202772 RepID=A0A1V9ZTF7_ACHHY|nr:hypothetical protein ACHHYP_20064 [Achlya hypogyna]